MTEDLNGRVRYKLLRAVVVAQLAEWLLPCPEVCSSHLAIGKISQKACFLLLTVEKAKINSKEDESKKIKLDGSRTAIFHLMLLVTRILVTHTSNL